MTEVRRGLPNNYRLEVTEEDMEGGPADLGDFLDDMSVQVRPQRPAPNEMRAPEAQPKVALRIAPTTSIPSDTSIAEASPDGRALAEDEREVAQSKVISKRPGRKQINMSLSTQNMLQELLEIIGRYSQEPNPTSSELLQALISALFDAKKMLKLSSLPARGAWGSKTAEIYQSCLKAEVMNAIGQHQFHRGELNSFES